MKTIYTEHQTDEDGSKFTVFTTTKYRDNLFVAYDRSYVVLDDHRASFMPAIRRGRKLLPLGQASEVHFLPHEIGEALALLVEAAR